MSFTAFEHPPTTPKPYQRKALTINYDSVANTLSVDLENDSLSLVVREISRLSRKNVVVGPRVDERLMNVYVTEASFDESLKLIAFANGLNVEIDTVRQVYRLMDSQGEHDAESKQQVNSRSNSTQSKRTTDNDFNITRIGAGRLSIEAINIPIVELIREAASVSLTNYILFSQPQGNAFIKVNNISFDDLLEV